MDKHETKLDLRKQASRGTMNQHYSALSEILGNNFLGGINFFEKKMKKKIPQDREIQQIGLIDEMTILS